MRPSHLLTVAVLFVTSLALGQGYRDLAAQATELYQGKEYAKSVAVFEAAFKIEAENKQDLYNAACAAALAGNPDLAFDWLQKAADRGWADPQHAQKDQDLVSLHDLPRWQPLIAELQKTRDTLDAAIDKPLRAELRTVLDEDQKYRKQLDEVKKTYGRDSTQMKDLWKTINQKDAENLAKVTTILDQRGWLGPDIVGEDGASALFLVIQHSDLRTQQKYLPMMRTAVKEKKARGSSLALLEDRVALREGRRQIYGSQIGTDRTTGQHYVLPLDDPENVDSRRAAVGLRPLAEYVKRWSIAWDVAEYKKQRPELEKLESRAP